MIDLHLHSDRSDGTLPPAELVARVAQAGVDTLALTDHDSTDGLAEAGTAALERGLRLVPGVEVSASWRNQPIHVLGLWIDPEAPVLRAALAGQAERRHERMRMICARLSERGLPGARWLAAVEARTALPTRTHLAEAIVAEGLAGDTGDAFRKFLGRGAVAQAAGLWPPLAEVIGWILGAGGLASLAHPMRYPLSAGARRRLLAEFAAAGGGAIEVVTGANAAHQIETCAALAGAHGLAGTVGSDFHDPKHAWNPLGRLAKLPPGVTPAWGLRETRGTCGWDG
ncbi:MAG: PHP domain-containing protein [Gammaproteobacteria bacterium]|nr:PHP domain-containing protein [Gammaproteobacteria bacterium]